MALEPGTLLSHYRLGEKIGEGGMGVVYRAHDTRLERDVALKVLPAGVLSGVLPDDAARKRFRKEALALSRLNHPNIATVFDFDTRDGVDFLVMEYIPGTTLDRKLATGPLSEPEIVRLGTQLCEGLTSAHEQGVLHRDLKPGNLRVTPDGRLKILDFGLAKLLQSTEDLTQAETETATRGIVGTLPYMAPEQLRAGNVDARVDLYAAGVVLYELATGSRPFREKLSTALTDDILHKPPPPPGRLNPEISDRLEQVLLKCLEKDPAYRYQTAKELAVDLRRLGSGGVSAGGVGAGGVSAGGVDAGGVGAAGVSADGKAVTPAPTPPHPRRWLHIAVGIAVIVLAGVVGSRLLNLPGPGLPDEAGRGKIMLAVLPFENLSADPEQEYFSDGMTEEMIAHLGRLQPQKLGVIARTSAMHYKNTTHRADEIGRELGVAYLLEGSVRRAGGRVRITAQLIQVSDQTHLWAENYERDLADVFALQKDVAARIANSLSLQLLAGDDTAPPEAGAVDSIAYDTYLKGLHHLRKRDRAGAERALSLFQETVNEAPGFALGYARLALAYLTLGNDHGLEFSEAEAREFILQAEAAANRALELDDSMAHPHAVLGDIRIIADWDLAAGRREYERAIELDPNYALAHHYYSTFLMVFGEFDRALAEQQRAYELDPLSPAFNHSLGYQLILSNRLDEGMSKLQTAIELGYIPSKPHRVLAWAYLKKGMLPEAIDEYEKSLILSGGSPDEAAELRRSFELGGIKGFREWELERLQRKSEQGRVSPLSFAQLHALSGNREQALEWLNECYETRDIGFLEAGYSYAFDDLRDDPRFKALLLRTGLRTE